MQLKEDNYDKYPGSLGSGFVFHAVGYSTTGDQDILLTSIPLMMKSTQGHILVGGEESKDLTYNHHARLLPQENLSRAG